MRVETILDESKLFTGEDECYIHLERTKGAPYKMVIAGDPVTLMQGVHNILSRISQLTNVPIKNLGKAVYTATKKFGVHIPMEEENED